jgi:hypothetical protein
MTITLTREEAQQVLDLMTRYRTETPLGHQPHMISHKADEAIETLRARLSAPKCICGEPNTAGVHRQDGPCYQQTEPDAIQYDKDGNEMAHWKFRSFLPAPEPNYRDVVIKGDLWRIEFLPDHAASVMLVRANYEAKLKEKNT